MPHEESGHGRASDHGEEASIEGEIPHVFREPTQSLDELLFDLGAIGEDAATRPIVDFSADLFPGVHLSRAFLCIHGD